jgi:hypothetical protein
LLVIKKLENDNNVITTQISLTKSAKYICLSGLFIKTPSHRRIKANHKRNKLHLLILKYVGTILKKIKIYKNTIASTT